MSATWLATSPSAATCKISKVRFLIFLYISEYSKGRRQSQRAQDVEDAASAHRRLAYLSLDSGFCRRDTGFPGNAAFCLAHAKRPLGAVAQAGNPSFFLRSNLSLYVPTEAIGGLFYILLKLAVKPLFYGAYQKFLAAVQLFHALGALYGRSHRYRRQRQNPLFRLLSIKQSVKEGEPCKRKNGIGTKIQRGRNLQAQRTHSDSVKIGKSPENINDIITNRKNYKLKNPFF